MRVNKTLDQQLRKQRIAANRLPSPQKPITQVELVGGWLIRANEEGHLVIVNKETGEETILAFKGE